MQDQKNPAGHLMVFGPGFTAAPIMARAMEAGWQVSATWRRPDVRDKLRLIGVKPVEFTRPALITAGKLASVTHILVSIAPGPGGDPVLVLAKDWLKILPNLKWIGYLSSTNVYGDHAGAWVDETSETRPSLTRGKLRLQAEAAWTALGAQLDVPVHIFRLAGIYGPGRNAIRSVLDGKARRVIKEGQVFGRIHRDDIAEAVWLAMRSDVPSEAFNLADDLPAPPQDVIAEAASLLGVDAPPEVPFEEAELSPMGRSFYTESKRVRNDKAKQLLGWQPAYPDYKTALPKLLEMETA